MIITAISKLTLKWLYNLAVFIAYCTFSLFRKITIIAITKCYNFITAVFCLKNKITIYFLFSILTHSYKVRTSHPPKVGAIMGVYLSKKAFHSSLLCSKNLFNSLLLPKCKIKLRKFRLCGKIVSCFLLGYYCNKTGYLCLFLLGLNILLNPQKYLSKFYMEDTIQII